MDATAKFNGTTLRDYLQWRADLGPAWGGLMEAMVLKHGRPGIARPHRFKPGREKYCFMNAAELVLRHKRMKRDELTYVEGFAMRRDLGIPIHHAWVIDHKGQVIETTWRKVDATTQYYGIPFSPAALRKELDRQEHYGLLDTPEGYNLRLLTQLDKELVERFLKRS